ncbi:SEL1-like repeat protein [Pseudovibrio sp. JE062]|uniref:tetratricopeptide repeat protein n=1 Tax=Pseudovibrio sp. JE062 TaxID=439495 RepID=UPI000186BEE5|nr:SEL1-like repeat protein [Pseudovibrio sp. JE062]EEA95641.1 Sel1 domain protein repeat-containing protein, putative [Pseudovibrio sp. JE062]
MISRVLSAFLLTSVCMGFVQGVCAAPYAEQERGAGLREVLEQRGYKRSVLEEHRSKVESIDFDELRLRAEQGDVNAQYQLGESFWLGDGVALDYEQAHYWLTKAVEQQHVDAKVLLAIIYERGHFVVPDPERAAELYFEAAQLGDDWAQAQLGRLYVDGEGVRKDVAYGLKILKQLAALEHYVALDFLGDFAKEGILDGSPDYEKAAEYYERGREAGSDVAGSRLAELIYDGHLGEVDIERVLSLLEEELEHSSPGAASDLADIYLEGRDVPKDIAKAVEYFELAAEWGSSYSLVRIGELYEEGDLGEPDYGKAAEYYQLARKQGNGTASGYLAYLKRYLTPEDSTPEEVIALYEESVLRGARSGMVGLGDCFRDGYGVETDHAKAREYYLQAVEVGSSLALVRLGNVYDEGLGVEKDYLKARQYYEDAIAEGYTNANADLAFLYQQGLGVEKDDQKAIELYELAREGGSTFAAYRLGMISYYGDGAEQDYSRSLKMFHEATRGGSKSAYDYLGFHYHYALGVRADYIEARYWYDAALAAGIDDVKIDLAFLEEDGLGGPRNKARAKRLYKESIEINSEARFHLVRMEDEADILDLKQDEHVAAYKAAMEKGSQAAKLELASIYLFSSDKHKDVEAAKQLLQELVKDGYSDAYVYMGAYYDEVSPEQDNAVEHAVKWFSKAADLGSHYAAKRLVWIVENNPPDGERPDKLAHWRQVQGLNGDAVVALEAAKDLEYSRIDQDLKLQERLYTVAANAGLLQAQLDLARKYIFGSEFPGNYERGIEILREAVGLHGPAQAYEITHQLSGGMTVDEMLKTDGTSRDWDRKHLTAVNLLYGLTVPKNVELAEKLVRSDPDRWVYSPETRYTLANIVFSKETPTQTEVEEALQALEISANSGYISAQRKLAELYEEGRHVDQNYRKAGMWYRIASSKIPSLKIHVARLILNGKVDANYGENALDILTSAAEQQDLLAIELLIEYWAEEEPDGYEHKRWARRYKTLSNPSS